MTEDGGQHRWPDRSSLAQDCTYQLSRSVTLLDCAIVTKTIILTLTSLEPRLDARKETNVNLGLDAKEFATSVIQYHENDKQCGVAEDEIDDDEIDDIFLSTRPPRQQLTIDCKYLNTVWTWLTNNPDISIKDISAEQSDAQGKPAQTTSQGHTDDTLGDHKDVLQDFINSKASSRLFTTEDRIWHALTDHGVNWKRIPPLEFQCLAVIAAKGPGGVLQPDVTSITGQDKRSLPKRTDSLHEKGYIIKESCLGGGVKTSLLRLKKFVTAQSQDVFFNIASNVTRESRKAPAGAVGEVGMIRYDQWFDKLIGLLKANNSLMAFDDLRKELVSMASTPR